MTSFYLNWPFRDATPSTVTVGGPGGQGFNIEIEGDMVQPMMSYKRSLKLLAGSHPWAGSLLRCWGACLLPASLSCVLLTATPLPSCWSLGT